MGRGRVELKRIEDKASRQVSFSKRRNGLMKKAHELSVLCDVDVALLVFSRKNRLYQFSTGDCMTEILNRYLDYKHADQTAHRSAWENLALKHKDGWTADDLTHMIQWHLDEHKLQQSDATELCQLEAQIKNILQQVRIRKTQMKLDFLKSLQQEQKQRKQEKQLMVREIMAAKLNESNIDG